MKKQFQFNITDKESIDALRKTVGVCRMIGEEVHVARRSGRSGLLMQTDGWHITIHCHICEKSITSGQSYRIIFGDNWLYVHEECEKNETKNQPENYRDVSA